MTPDLKIDGETHTIHQQTLGSLDGGPVELNRAGRCRFCGQADARKFRKVAHALPESLSNKWLVSLDECDDCNAMFSRYEDALAKRSLLPAIERCGSIGLLCIVRTAKTHSWTRRSGSRATSRLPPLARHRR